MKKKAIICDLDGTFFNCEHRRHFVECEKPDWKSFLHPVNLEQDIVNEWCREILTKFTPSYYLLFVTGREEELRDCTNEILAKNLIIGWSNLYMRKSKDYRQDSIIKEEIYKEEIEPHYDVLFCIDDRKQVVDMWRSLGLTCLQCAEGNF